MRDAIDDYVERGGRVARFAGNFMWQTRLELGGKRQVCYKYRARAEDPVFKSADPSRTSGSWEAKEIGRPGAETFGLNATNGLYAGWGGCAPRGVRGFPVYRPEHWAFADTGLGDLLGAEGHAFGYEVDGLDYVIRGGLPEPSETSGAPEGLQILALGDSTHGGGWRLKRGYRDGRASLFEVERVGEVFRVPITHPHRLQPPTPLDHFED